MADTKLSSSSPTRTALVAAEAARTDRHAPTLALKSMKTTWKDLVKEDQLTPDGYWMSSTTKDGKPCFKFSKSDKKPALFEQSDWKTAVRAALEGKCKFKYTSGAQLLKKNEITQAQYDALAESSKQREQFWRKEAKQEGDAKTWRPKTKFHATSMVTYVNTRGSAVTFEKKLDAKAPSVPRGPHAKTETKTEVKTETKDSPKKRKTETKKASPKKRKTETETEKKASPKKRKTETETEEKASPKKRKTVTKKKASPVRPTARESKTRSGKTLRGIIQSLDRQPFGFQPAPIAQAYRFAIKLALHTFAIERFKAGDQFWLNIVLAGPVQNGFCQRMLGMLLQPGG